MSRRLWAWAVWLALATPGLAVEIPQPAVPVTIDGDLHEWGRAAWITVVPAGEGVGLRGVFDSDSDHDAVVLVQWDARFLYVAAAIHDDTLDAGRVHPEDREWRGPSGERKDRLFYFDHFKLFVREPGADAGYNLWFAPPMGQDPDPYWWGGRQRQAPRERPEIEVASAVRPGARTFEMAVPWTWMDAYPQPGDPFDALFLFTDSDRPGEQVAVKIGRQLDRWIWWQGVLELTGVPEGLRPRPAPETPISYTEPSPAPEVDLDPRIERAIARSREADATASDPASVPSPAAPSGATSAAGATHTETAADVEAATGDTPVAPSTRSGRSLQALMNRQLLGRRPPTRAPDWLHQIVRDPELTAAQVDSFYAVLRRSLSRIVNDGVNSRVDFFIVDMAHVAGSRREQAREFLTALLGQLEGPPNETSSARLAYAATATGNDPEAVTRLVREIGARGRRLFAEGGITTSSDLLGRGAKAAGLSSEEALELVGVLVGVDAGDGPR